MIAEPQLAVPVEPPARWPPAGPCRRSAAGPVPGRSSASAAIWVSAVQAPVPRSTAPICTVEVPSARRARSLSPPPRRDRSRQPRRSRSASRPPAPFPVAGCARPSRTGGRPRAGRRCLLPNGLPVSGSMAGSFRTRSSIGSIPHASASSSIATSRPNEPGALARRPHPGRDRNIQRRQPVGGAPVVGRYIIRDIAAVCSANSLIATSAPPRRASAAEIRPSGLGAQLQPLDGRRAVAGQEEHLLPAQRDFTGRPPVTFAASAVSTTCACGSPLEPNPPPTCGATTRSAPPPRRRAAPASCARCARPLRGVEHQQPVAVPLRHGGVRFHRIVVLGRGCVGAVNNDGGARQGGVRVSRSVFAARARR